MNASMINWSSRM